MGFINLPNHLRLGHPSGTVSPTLTERSPASQAELENARATTRLVSPPGCSSCRTVSGHSKIVMFKDNYNFSSPKQNSEAILLSIDLINTEKTKKPKDYLTI